MIAVGLFAMLALAQAVVVQPVSNMYARPSDDADVASQAIYASNVTVLDEQSAWTRVRTADDYTGWIRSAELRKLAAGERAYASGGRVAQVESLFAHLYREASVTKHAPLITMPFETRLEMVAEQDERWIQVRLPDDRSAWVQRGDVRLDCKPESIEQTIALAKRFLGLPYTWGGTSSFGFDCSGYTQMLCRRRGVLLPRDAGPQADWSGLRSVERTALEPGDLLYFGSSAEKITHTGMYIGNGEFVHATAHLAPMVQISRLADQHWTELLVACRRVK